MTSSPDCTDLIQHDIKLLLSDPVRSRGYLIPFKTLEVMETEIQEMHLSLLLTCGSGSKEGQFGPVLL